MSFDAKSRSLGTMMLIVTLLVAAGFGSAQSSAATWDFQDVTLGALPPGWQIEGTNQHGPLATWQVVADKTAPGDGHVLALTKTNHTSGGTFNLCWTDSVAFGDGEIQVSFKAFTGHEDQGGGLMWRVLDRDNYYVARFNPLEDNFRLYKVHNGARRTLASARTSLSAGQWHTMKIIQNGPEFAAYLDGKKLLAGHDDTFKKPGGVGLWTKADAVTSFTAFSVHPATTAIEAKP